MSVGTIVVIVLSMSMLILGLVLVKTIFSGAKNVAEMTDDQVTEELTKMFGVEQKVAVYPSTKQIDIVQGRLNGFGVGIKNLQGGSTGTSKFSYEVIVSDSKVREKCGVTETEILNLITTGQTEVDIPIASGEIYSSKVLFSTQEGDPLCTVRLRVDAKVNNAPYGSPQIMDVTFKGA
jgi:hypothetical protein